MDAIEEKYQEIPAWCSWLPCTPTGEETVVCSCIGKLYLRVNILLLVLFAPHRRAAQVNTSIDIDGGKELTAHGDRSGDDWVGD